MLRHVLGNVNRQICRHFRNCRCSMGRNSTSNDTIAYEVEYFYNQDKKLLEMVKQKTEGEIKIMQEEVQAMRDKIEEYNHYIEENIRYLKGLEKNVPASNEK